jgi:hypothetical protein
MIIEHHKERTNKPRRKLAPLTTTFKNLINHNYDQYLATILYKNGTLQLNQQDLDTEELSLVKHPTSSSM